MAFGEGEPGSVEEAEQELSVISPILSNREAWIARAGFLSGWITAVQGVKSWTVDTASSAEKEPAASDQ